MSKDTLQKMIDELKKGLENEIEYFAELKSEYSQYPDWISFCDREVESRKQEFGRMIEKIELELNSMK